MNSGAWELLERYKQTLHTIGRVLRAAADTALSLYLSISISLLSCTNSSIGRLISRLALFLSLSLSLSLSPLTSLSLSLSISPLYLSLSLSLYLSTLSLCACVFRDQYNVLSLYLWRERALSASFHLFRVPTNYQSAYRSKSLPKVSH
eukprot:sb/3473710/